MFIVDRLIVNLVFLSSFLAIFQCPHQTGVATIIMARACAAVFSLCEVWLSLACCTYAARVAGVATG